MYNTSECQTNVAHGSITCTRVNNIPQLQWRSQGGICPPFFARYITDLLLHTTERRFSSVELKSIKAEIKPLQNGRWLRASILARLQVKGYIAQVHRSGAVTPKTVPTRKTKCQHCILAPKGVSNEDIMDWRVVCAAHLSSARQEDCNWSANINTLSISYICHTNKY